MPDRQFSLSLSLWKAGRGQLNAATDQALETCVRAAKGAHGRQSGLGHPIALAAVDGPLDLAQLPGDVASHRLSGLARYRSQWNLLHATFQLRLAIGGGVHITYEQRAGLLLVVGRGEGSGRTLPGGPAVEDDGAPAVAGCSSLQAPCIAARSASIQAVDSQAILTHNHPPGQRGYWAMQLWGKGV